MTLSAAPLRHIPIPPHRLPCLPLVGHTPSDSFTMDRLLELYQLGTPARWCLNLTSLRVLQAARCFQKRGFLTDQHRSTNISPA
jgi:hypothetical protein